MDLIALLSVISTFFMAFFCSFLLYFVVSYRGPPTGRLIALGLFTLVGGTGTPPAHFASTVYTLSFQMLQSWKHDYFRQPRAGIQWEVQRKYLRTLRTIRITLGGLYIYDDKFVLNLWHEIIDKAIALISSFPLH
jgi:hypothetical protein